MGKGSPPTLITIKKKALTNLSHNGFLTQRAINTGCFKLLFKVIGYKAIDNTR